MKEHAASETRKLDLYEVLQVSPSAGPDVIHAAYRALARAHHPDLNRVPEAHEAMRKLNASYRVLSDAARRARYDAYLARQARQSPRRRMATTERLTSRALGARELHPRASARQAVQPAVLAGFLLIVAILCASCVWAVIQLMEAL